MTWAEGNTVRALVTVTERERKLSHSAIGMSSTLEAQSKQSKEKGRKDAENHGEMAEGL